MLQVSLPFNRATIELKNGVAGSQSRLERRRFDLAGGDFSRQRINTSAFQRDSHQTGKDVFTLLHRIQRPIDISQRNRDVQAYAAAIREIAIQRGAVFIDLFGMLTSQLPKERLTDNGMHLTTTGLREVSQRLPTALGAKADPSIALESVRAAVVVKNGLWFDCWRPANWSFVYGDRITSQYGKGASTAPDLQRSFEQQRSLVEAADARIHLLARGHTAPLLAAPPALPAADEENALSPEDELATFTMAEGYTVNLFASERDGVVNPTQFSWDEDGRLYVACSPSYPQTLASVKPSDYILVLEDTDADGKADKSWRFAEGLSMVQGVEVGDGGAFVCDYDKLLHFSDQDHDGKADTRRLIYSGFGSVLASVTPIS